MRCTRTGCRKRFKGLPFSDAVCPRCGSNAKRDPWANRKPWRKALCVCGAYLWDAPHRRGGGDCIHNPKFGGVPIVELPGIDGDFPF